MAEKDEIRMIRQAQKGDVDAFEALVALHDRQVMKLAFNMLGSATDAEDVYQDIFIQVFRKLKTFRFKSRFSTWLYRIVVNHCITFRKRRSRQTTDSLDHHFEFAKQGIGLADEHSNPERTLLNQELRDHLNVALDCLPDRQRAVFVLRHFHGHKLQEIAGILNCAEGTVKNYLFRATRQMQKRMRAYQQDWL